MPKYKAIIFDMDGLLFDTEKLYYQASQEVADEMQFPYSQATYQQCLGRSDEETWQIYHDLYDDKYGSDQVNLFIERAFAKVVTLFKDGQVNLKAGAKDLLAYLQEEQVPCVLASSNQRELIELLLSKQDLTEYFQEIISVENVTKAKPDPEIFLCAKSCFDLADEEILVLEDSASGVLAARSAGLDTIMIPDLLLPNQETRRLVLNIYPSLKEVLLFLKS